MRGLLVAAVSIASLAGSVTAARAHVMICVGPHEVQTPVNPVFIVAKWQDRASGLGGANHLEAASRDGTQLETRITSLDTFWSRVEVVAPHGSEFSLQRGSRRYQPSSSWSDVRQAPRVTEIRELDRGILVRTDVAKRQALRVEWSYTPEDLEAKKHGLLIEGPPRCERTNIDFIIPAARHAEIVYMRLVPLLMDGTSGPAWEGWIHRDPQTQHARVGQGPPPATSGRLTHCDTQHWTVGENPTFTFHGGFRLFRATTRDGRSLATTVDDGLARTRVTVTASEGTTFQLEAIPTGLECPLTVSVARHTIGSRVLASSMTVINDTLLSVKVAPSPTVSRLHVGTIHTIDSTGAPIIDGNVVVALNDAVWRLEAEYATAGQSGFWLSAFDRGFEGPSCYIGIARDSATGNITTTGAQGPSGEPSCFDPVGADTTVADNTGAARSSIASQRRRCAGDSSASFIAMVLCFLAAAGLQRRFCANAL